MTTPAFPTVVGQAFTPELAATLLAAGWTCQHIEESWEDIGGPESGPQVVGGPACDCWSLGALDVIVVAGVVDEQEVNPFFGMEPPF